MPMERMLKEVLGLLVFSVAVALLVNQFSPVGIALVGNWDTEKGAISAKARGEETPEGMEITAVAAARAVFDAGGALFVDARTQDLYDEGHIAGALSYPVGEMEERIEGFITEYPPEQAIVAYCSGRECEDSHKLARFLIDMGYTRVRVFIDGFPAWQKEGHPVE